MIRRINIAEVIKELGYDFSSIPDVALQKLDVFSKECVQCSDEDVRNIVKTVIECYSKSPEF